VANASTACSSNFFSANGRGDVPVALPLYMFLTAGCFNPTVWYRTPSPLLLGFFFVVGQNTHELRPGRGDGDNVLKVATCRSWCFEGWAGANAELIMLSRICGVVELTHFMIDELVYCVGDGEVPFPCGRAAHVRLGLFPAN
jgi:hypothetical protein